MERRNYNGAQFSQSMTIVEKAGIEIEDCRNRAMAYDSSGNVVPASDGTKPIVGIALVEAGQNDISGSSSGRAAIGEDVDIQIKDIGFILAGDRIAKGAEVTAMAGGFGTAAAAGDYVVGLALDGAEKGDCCMVQISKYQKAGSPAGGSMAGPGGDGE